MTVSYLDAAYEVLAEAQTPLHYGQITQRALDQGLIKPSGQTPENTMASRLSKDIQSEGSRFVRLGEGLFALSDSAGITLRLQSIGQLRDVSLTFGDLTVLVGPQASGKSIALQWLKLLLDTGYIQSQLSNYGLDWSRSLSEFLDLYFGDGMHSIWSSDSQVTWAGRKIDVQARVSRMQREKTESVFFVPAQRVLTLRDGWPRPFGDYTSGDPYVVRAFSERLRLLMEQEFGQLEAVFPKANRLKAQYRDLLVENVYGNFELSLDRSRFQKRLVLRAGKDGASLPYMVWSAGQREFTPLMLGLYWLMPPAKITQRDQLKWAIIEEPEMGLHPRAISTVLVLVLELLARNYRVCLSTHSPQILDLVWSLRVLRETQAPPDQVLRIFDLPSSQPLRKVAKAALSKTINVYYFERQAGCAHDISNLDPGSEDRAEAYWGGLTEFSGRANDVVANAIANHFTEEPK